MVLVDYPSKTGENNEVTTFLDMNSFVSSYRIIHRGVCFAKTLPLFEQASSYLIRRQITFRHFDEVSFKI